MKKYILGIEVGYSNIKLLECRRKKGQLIIEKSHKITTPKGAISNGIISDGDAIYKAIKKEIKTNQYRSKEIVALVESSEIITRDICIPLMPKRDMDIILPLQYQEYLLVDLSQYQVTYKVKGDGVKLGQTKGETGQELLIVAAPNKIIFPLIEIANKLKMRVKAINIATSAVANIFSKYNGIATIKEEKIMVVDIGGQLTTITIISEGIGVLNKEITFGVAENNEASTYEMELETILVAEIRKLLKFYLSQDKNNIIQKIYIIGGGSYLNHIDEYMADKLQISCISGIEFDQDLVQFNEELRQDSACFINLLGLVNEF